MIFSDMSGVGTVRLVPCGARQGEETGGSRRSGGAMVSRLVTRVGGQAVWNSDVQCDGSALLWG